MILLYLQSIFGAKVKRDTGNLCDEKLIGMPKSFYSKGWVKDTNLKFLSFERMVSGTEAKLYRTFGCMGVCLKERREWAGMLGDKRMEKGKKNDFI